MIDRYREIVQTKTQAVLFKNLETKTKQTDGDKNTSPDTNFVKVVSYLKWVLTSVENLKKLSSERVQPVPIYWQYIPLDTKNFFRASAERIQPVSIYWRIIPSSKKRSVDDYFLDIVLRFELNG